MKIMFTTEVETKDKLRKEEVLMYMNNMKKMQEEHIN